MGFINNVNVDVRGASHIAPCTYKTVILKKNITKENLNVLTQAMLDEYNINTKFVIKWDYVLKTDIIIPNNCILEFDGGSISGEYTITGQNTGIEAGLVKILGIDVTLTGSWTVVEAYPEWFGAVGDGVEDDGIALNKWGINMFKSNLKAINKTYITSIPISIKLYSSELNLISSKIIASESYNSNEALVTIQAALGITTNRHDNVVMGGFIDANDIAKIGVCVNSGLIIRLNNLHIKNCKEVGLLLDYPNNLGYKGSVYVNDLTVFNENTVYDGSVGIKVYLPDSYINNSEIKNFNYCLQSGVSTNILGLHGWVEPSQVPEGIVPTFVNFRGGYLFLNDSYIDGLKRVFYIGIGGTIVNTNHKWLFTYNSQTDNKRTLLYNGSDSALTIVYSDSNGVVSDYPVNILEKSFSKTSVLNLVTKYNVQSEYNGNVCSVNTYTWNVYKDFSNFDDINVDCEFYINTNSYANIGNQLWFITPITDYLLYFKNKVVISDNGDLCLLQTLIAKHKTENKLKEFKRYLNKTDNTKTLYWRTTRLFGYTLQDTLTSVDYGQIIFNESVYPKKPYIKDDSNKFVDFEGNLSTVKKRGTTAERPTGGIQDGFIYIDTALGKTIFANNINRNTNPWTIYWNEMDGAAAGVARNGVTEDRPLGSYIYIGFQYFDITLGKPIYAKTIIGNEVTWVDATGTTV